MGEREGRLRVWLIEILQGFHRVGGSLVESWKLWKQQYVDKWREIETDHRHAVSREGA